MLTTPKNQPEPAMLSSSLQITIALWQPLHLRVWRRVVDTVHAARLGLQRNRHEHVLSARRQREWNGLAELSAHTLKDIGAPDWLVLDATERGDMARQRLDEFSTWRGV
jgi:uncharacterized protein YjiS (DUF1127 family)